MANRYISDLHLGHSNILRMEEDGLNKRKKFRDIAEMNEHIIRQWNTHVDDEDHVYIVGDLSYRSKEDVGTKFLSRMRGHKHLIIGNHDIKWMKNTELDLYFESVSFMDVIKDGEKTITICHYPVFEWPQSRYAKYSKDGVSWLIHGHIHDSVTCDTYHYIKEKLPCALNAGYDIPGNDYPVTFEELLENNDKWYDRGGVM